MNDWSDVEREPPEGEQPAAEHPASEHPAREHPARERVPHAADERLLEQLRDWLARTRAEAEAVATEPHELREPDDPDDPAVALHDIVAAFTALRHDVKLETRSARALREQSEGLLSALHEATRRFDSARADEAKAAHQATRPLAESLAELDEILERGLAALGQARRQALDEFPPGLQQVLDENYRRLPWWRRWTVAGFYRAVRQAWTEHAVSSQRALWDSLAEGYRLMHGRLRRAMEGHGIRRILTVGRPVDPHAMTVIEAVDAPGRPPGTVAEELRPGYRWNGQVLRFAEVRAVRAAAPGSPAETAGPAGLAGPAGDE